jgi:hypothetical protein
VPPDLALASALAQPSAVSPLGVWFRGARRSLALVATLDCHAHLLLIDSDLGRLLRRCSAVLVRLGPDVAAVPADELIRVRALRIVAGLPYVPTIEALCALFPDSRDVPAGVEVPLRHRSAEEILAACATARTPILCSRVVYGRVGAARGGG